jgi:ABC-type phosphate transport system ATPase subunit
MAKEKKTATAETINNNDFIEVFGAGEHNLKNIDIKIPKNRLVVFTGVSGIVKSSSAYSIRALSSYAMINCFCYSLAFARCQFCK